MYVSVLQSPMFQIGEGVSIVVIPSKAPITSNLAEGSTSRIPEENSTSRTSDSITAGLTQHSGEDESIIKVNFAVEVVQQIETLVVVLPKSSSVWFFEDFCEPGTGPMVQFRQMSEPWTGP